MSDEQINIAIAEACGWTDVWNPVMSTSPVGTSPENFFGHIPRYCNDLNAMHEAEKTLPESLRYCYAALLNTLHPTCDLEYPDQTERGFRKKLFSEAFGILHATAAQRAEAFIRTIGKWEEAVK
jgi:hypothetical protein